MNAKNSLVVSLYGGPCSGKSTTMAGVFAKLKCLGIEAEMTSEFAKEKIWENSIDLLNNQIYVFGQQLQSIVRLVGKVDVVVTDSPLLLSIIYGKNEVPEFKPLVIAVNKRFRMLNFFLRRSTPFHHKGRIHNESESKDIDQKIELLLSEVKAPFNYVDVDKDAVMNIVNATLLELKTISDWSQGI